VDLWWGKGKRWRHSDRASKGGEKRLELRVRGKKNFSISFSPMGRREKGGVITDNGRQCCMETFTREKSRKEGESRISLPKKWKVFYLRCGDCISLVPGGGGEEFCNHTRRKRRRKGGGSSRVNGGLRTRTR